MAVMQTHGNQKKVGAVAPKRRCPRLLLFGGKAVVSLNRGLIEYNELTK
jgi:hypothetical protein